MIAGEKDEEHGFLCMFISITILFINVQLYIFLNSFHLTVTCANTTARDSEKHVSVANQNRGGTWRFRLSWVVAFGVRVKAIALRDLDFGETVTHCLGNQC